MNGNGYTGTQRLVPNPTTKEMYYTVGLTTTYCTLWLTKANAGDASTVVPTTGYEWLTATPAGSNFTLNNIAPGVNKFTITVGGQAYTLILTKPTDDTILTVNLSGGGISGKIFGSPNQFREVVLTATGSNTTYVNMWIVKKNAGDTYNNTCLTSENGNTMTAINASGSGSIFIQQGINVFNATIGGITYRIRVIRNPISTYTVKSIKVDYTTGGTGVNNLYYPCGPNIAGGTAQPDRLVKALLSNTALGVKTYTNLTINKVTASDVVTVTNTEGNTVTAITNGTALATNCSVYFKTGVNTYTVTVGGQSYVLKITKE